MDIRFCIDNRDFKGHLNENSIAFFLKNATILSMNTVIQAHPKHHYGDLKTLIIKGFSSFSGPFSSTDIFKTLKNDIPGLKRSTISTSLIRMAIKGEIESKKEGRTIFFEKVD